MVLILDDNSEIGVHLRSNLCYLISVRHWIKSRAVTKVGYFFLSENPIRKVIIQYTLHV